jgi:hypothetical protein
MDHPLSLPCTKCTLILNSTLLNMLQVYRMAADDIGCSLAEAAEAKPYEAYLAQAQATPRSLHVVRAGRRADQAEPTRAAHPLVPTDWMLGDRAYKCIVLTNGSTPAGVHQHVAAHQGVRA